MRNKGEIQGILVARKAKTIALEFEAMEEKKFYLIEGKTKED